MTADAGPGVLDGVEVVDLSSGIAGPMTTMMLADNGARVIKVDPPGGDPFAAQSGYTVWQRGKERCTVDLATVQGRAALTELVAGADVVVDSYAPGTAARLGVDHATLSAANERLISCSITGYGRGNRHSSRPGYDALVAARTGLLYDHRGRPGTPMDYICGRPAPHPDLGVPEGLVRGADGRRDGPLFPRSTWPSLGAAFLATLGISAALRAREVTGRGQWVETSLLQGALAAVALNWQRVEHPDAPLYWMWPVDSRSIEGLFECADGRWVHHWIVRPNWVTTVSAGDALVVPDPEHNYRNDPDRIGMEADDLLTGYYVYGPMADAFRRFPSTEWARVAAESGMGVALVRSPGEALADPALLADGCVVEVEHPEHGRIRHVGNVLEFSATPGGVRGSVQPNGPLPAPRPVPPPSTRPVGAALGAPLEGVRVLDLGLGVAGPFGPKMLADLGADVIKVHALHDTFWAGTHMGLGTNRGKRSISLNLKDPRGREVLMALIDRADVVATNWRPGAAARLGIDYDSLRARRPGLVFCNTRGYERGPRAALPGTDQTANALSGPEWEDGACNSGNPPVWSRCGMGDTGNALLAAIAMTLALYHRDRTGDGQAVSTSIVNACLLNSSYAWAHADGTPGPWLHVDGDQYGLGPYYRLYRVSDGWVFVAAVTEPQRAALHTALGTATTDAIAAALEDRAALEAFKVLDDAGVPVEIVDEAFCRDLFDDAEARQQRWVATTWAGGVGRFEDPGLLVNFSATPGVVRRGPCLCGQHTREILRELGYTDDAIDVLSAEKVVHDAPVPAPPG